MKDVVYRFSHEKDASWNSFRRQKERYDIIKSYLGSDSVGAEIGVYKGGFGEFLLSHCKKLYLVDPWYRLKPYWGLVSPENSAVDALINILQVYHSDIDQGRVEVIVDYSTSFLNSLPAGSLDWVYLDASHSYDRTVSELEAATRVIRHGGFLCGDDYDPDPSSHQHGVFRAVNEMVAQRQTTLIINEGRQWGIRVL